MFTRALLALLFSACPAPEPPPEAPGTEVEVVTPAAPRARTAAIRLHAVGVEVERAESEVVVRVDTVIAWDRAVEYDGLSSGSRAALVAAADVVLLAGGVEVPVEGLPAMPDSPPGYLRIPYEPPRRVRVPLAFRVPGRDLPEDLALRVEDDTGAALLRLRGRARTADGAPAVEVLPVAPSGHPLAGHAVLSWVGGEVVRDGGMLPLLVPADARGASLLLPGRAPTPVSWDAGAAQVSVSMALLGDPTGAAIAALWPTLPDDPASRDVAELASRLRTPDQIAAWIREHVAVLPAHGLQRSPSATLRLGAGSPVERAILARELLAWQQRRCTLVCGDLPPDEARAISVDRVELPPLPEPLSGLVASGRERVAPLAEELGLALEGLGDVPPGRRARAALLPEWCWVELEPDRARPGPLAQADRERLALDLVPGAGDHPRPFAWRTTDQVEAEQWRVTLWLRASVTRPDGTPGEVFVLDYDAATPALTDAALLLDVYPSPTPGRIRTQLTALDDAEAGGRLGAELDASRLQTLTLAVSVRDPSGLATRSFPLTLWDVTEGQPLRSLRVLLGGDTGARGPEPLAARLADAVDGAYPLPAAAALWARHELYSLLRLHLAGGAVPAEPPLLVTVAAELPDGIGWWFEAVGAGSPAGFGPAAPGAVAGLAAVDAVARALVLGAGDPIAPLVWLRGPEDLGKLPPVRQSTQLFVARSLERLVFGAEEVGPGEIATLWSLDPVSGGLTWTAPFPQVVTDDLPVRTDVTPGMPPWVVARWDLPVRCAEAARWAGLVGVALPEACRPPAASGRP